MSTKEEIIKMIKDGIPLDRNDWRMKNLGEKSKELLEPLFLQNDIQKNCKNMLDHLSNVNDVVNIIDEDFPYPCSECGCQSFRVIKSWRYVYHYAFLRCNHCNTFGQWVTQEHVESKMTKLTRKLNMTGNFDDIDNALEIK